MTVWDAEIKELEKLIESFKGQLPVLEKEVEQLIKTQDPNVVMLYSRRSLEVIITELCESELNRPRKTEPLKGIIDKLNSEEKVPSHIIASMHSLNSMSTYGAHPKDFDPQQVKPVLNNLAIIIGWYLKYKNPEIANLSKGTKEKEETKHKEPAKDSIGATRKKRLIILSGSGMTVLLIFVILALFKVIGGKGLIGDQKSTEPSIAVLAFTDMSPGHDQEYLGDGIAQEILEKLSKISDLMVTARASSFSFKGKNDDIREIGKKLNVAHVLTGSVRKEEDQIRVTVELINAATGRLIYSEPYNYESKKILSLESDIAIDVAQKIKSKLSPSEKPVILTKREVNPEAYEAYLKGRMELNKGFWDVNIYKKAKLYFEKAIGIDPEFSEAYALLSVTNSSLAMWAYPWTEKRKALDSIEFYAKKAMLLDADNYISHLSLAVLYENKYDWINASKEVDKAYGLNPGESKARKATYLILLDKSDDEAVKLAREAARLDPFNTSATLNYANILYYAQRYDEAIEVCRGLIDSDSTITSAYSEIGLCYAGKKEYNRALWFLSKQHIRRGNQKLGEIYLTSDFKTSMKAFLKYIDSPQGTEYLDRNYQSAFVYAYLDDKENTIKYLYRAFENYERNLMELKRYYLFDFIRDDPRFIALYEKAGFKAYDEYLRNQKSSAK